MFGNENSQDWLISSSKKKLAGSFDDTYASCLQQVACNSPAAQMNLCPGDYLVSIDGVPAYNVDILEWLLEGEGHIEYQFFSTAKNLYINLTTNRIPLGFVAEPSSNALIARGRSQGVSEWYDFELLWKRRSWSQLLELCEIFDEGDSIVTRILQKFLPDFGRSAEVLFRGAALYELGEEQAGIEQVLWFIDNESQNHESYMHAIAYFYAAKWSELIGDADACKQWLSQANRSNRGRLDRIAHEVYLKKYELPSVSTHWSGQYFPARYELDALDGSARVSLEETLDSMRPDEYLPVCVMPSYRGNGPYNEALLCYRASFSYMAHRLRPMQVITDVRQKREDREWWYENEEAALESNIPLILLFDKNRAVADKIDTDFTPIFYLLNNKGLVEYEGQLKEPCDYWEVLGRLSPQRKAA